jgi:hypothetical protein
MTVADGLPASCSVPWTQLGERRIVDHRTVPTVTKAISCSTPCFCWRWQDVVKRPGKTRSGLRRAACRGAHARRFVLRRRGLRCMVATHASRLPTELRLSIGRFQATNCDPKVLCRGRCGGAGVTRPMATREEEMLPLGPPV